jgi:Copper type II ascorbate-dependent monooxygenase, C-terminal domain
MRATWLVLLCACGGGGEGDPGTDAAPPSGWQTLLAKSWQLAPGGEKTSDLAIETLARDVVIGGLRPLSPKGTHHTLLYRGTSGTNVVYASGVGTNELMFPPGTAMRIPAGTTLGLQLHIFNQTDEMITGQSGIEFLEVDPAGITEEVDMFLPGPQDLAITPGLHTKTGTCTVKSASKLFALFPHMHQLGTHMKTTLVQGTNRRVLDDAPYDFEHQRILSFEPIAVSPGDKIESECTWMNTTSNVVSYGESSTTEMCYSILYRYPRGTEEFCHD